MSLNYRLRNDRKFSIQSQDGQHHYLSPELFLNALNRVHKIVDQIDEFEVNISEILGMRNLSAFVGELFVAGLAKEFDGMFLKNPHQDGYPDLLLLDSVGKAELERIESAKLMKAKGPFSPFISGGVEVKATCGSVPTPAQCKKKGFEKPGIGDQRIDFMKGYDWKAHHRETNNLAGILWDFIDLKPRITAVFFSSNLLEEDWGVIVKPKAGGGRTTSVSIMTRAGVHKMYANWALVLNDERYVSFLNHHNKDSLL